MVLNVERRACGCVLWTHYRLLFHAYIQEIDPMYSNDKIERIDFRSTPPDLDDAKAVRIARERYDSIAVYRLQTNTTTTFISYVFSDLRRYTCCNEASKLPIYCFVRYLFRGKMMHQRQPRRGYSEEDDVHNEMLK